MASDSSLVVADGEFDGPWMVNAGPWLVRVD